MARFTERPKVERVIVRTVPIDVIDFARWDDTIPQGAFDAERPLPSRNSRFISERLRRSREDSCSDNTPGSTVATRCAVAASGVLISITSRAAGVTKPTAKKGSATTATRLVDGMAWQEAGANLSE